MECFKWTHFVLIFSGKKLFSPNIDNSFKWIKLKSDKIFWICGIHWFDPTYKVLSTKSQINYLKLESKWILSNLFSICFQHQNIIIDLKIISKIYTQIAPINYDQFLYLKDIHNEWITQNMIRQLYAILLDWMSVVAKKWQQFSHWECV